MNRNGDTTPAPTMVTTADHAAPVGAKAETGMAILADHDPTLKWIVSDLEEGGEQTPPPLTENIERTPPPEKTPVGERTPPPDTTPGVAVRAVDYKGAEPAEFLAADPTPPPPSTPLRTEILGAAPMAILPGPTGSDSELPADAVEIIPHSADEMGATSSDLDDTPPDGISTRPTSSKPEFPVATEPREVEPDVLE